MSIFGRTDLASEAHRIWSESAEKTGSLKGVKALREELSGHSVTAVEILDEEGSRALGKPLGKYYTLDLEDHFERGSESFPKAAEALAGLIGRCVQLEECNCFLIAALGNPDMTPDALGSITASNIIVTRHLKASSPDTFKFFRSTALCRTGVLGTTGIESAAQIRTLCQEIKPDCVIAVDSLAGSDVLRLCRTIQVCSSGIAPGSGVGNNREALNQETLGIPVVAIGMPTVIDASSLSMEGGLSSMFVTPRDIDSSVRSAGRLIGYGINLALHRDISILDVDMLIG